MEGVQTRSSGLQYRVLEAADPGAPLVKTPRTPCQVYYVGRRTDGVEVMTNHGGPPLTCSPDRVQRAWAEALSLMREGDKWEILVPPELGFGGQLGPRPHEVLLYELELHRVATGPGR
jgi:FKBP-type peptidyl-prolyl cis-trans isomerase FklB